MVFNALFLIAGKYSAKRKENTPEPEPTPPEPGPTPPEPGPGPTPPKPPRPDPDPIPNANRAKFEPNSSFYFDSHNGKTYRMETNDK
jgi:hypothetical protein